VRHKPHRAEGFQDLQAVFLQDVVTDFRGQKEPAKVSKHATYYGKTAPRDTLRYSDSEKSGGGGHGA
jgi:hypothetical protein